MLAIDKLYWMNENDLRVTMRCDHCGEENTESFERGRLNSKAIKSTGLFGFISDTSVRLGHRWDGWDVTAPYASEGSTNENVEKFADDYILAARLGMTQMLKSMRPYLAYLLQQDKLVANAFFNELADISSKVACDWARFVFACQQDEDH